MEIVKLFQDNVHITILGTHEEPLFRASDIGIVLEMTNIRASIQNFGDSEKRGVNTIDAIGRNQETTFLTEKGLYKILFKSRKPIAEKFQDWVCEVIKEIRLSGIFELKKQLEDKDKEIISNTEKILINAFSNKPVFYIGKINENTVKFGYTNNITDRCITHKKEIGKDFIIIYAVESVYNREIEQLVKKRLRLYIIDEIHSSKKQTEIIKLDENFKLEQLYKEITKLKNLCNKTTIELIEEIERLNIELSKFKEKEEFEIRIKPKKEIKIKNQSNTCNNCGKEIKKESKRCVKCTSTLQPRKVQDRPTLEQLEKDKEELGSYEKVGKKYDVAHTTVIKWIKRYKEVEN